MKVLAGLLSPLFLLCVALPLSAQKPCSPPAVPVSKEPNIFNAQQEMDLGDAIAEQVQKDYHVIDDDEINGHLRGIGERIARGLPPTGMKLQFFVVDLPEANAFTLPGGRIYVTRKLITFARTEDELAGVIAHELGHGLMHHAAIDMTRLLRETLGVTQVTDRRDIFEKYNLLIESARRKGVRGRDHENDQQLEADRSGLYAMMAAGYDPHAFSSFWDRFVETKGKTGNWFTDLFGTTKPEQKRLREMIKASSAVAANCIAARSGNTDDDFKKWQATVVVYSGSGRKELLHSVLFKINLTPPLRGEIRYLRFSPDGKYILAQDDSGINVISRNPFSLLFRIEAPEVEKAMFSPDSQIIVFYNSNLHVERWNVGDGTKVDAHEVVTTHRSCLQAQVSSDGKTVACFDNQLTLSLYDVATNELLFRKEEFYTPQNFFEYLMYVMAVRAGDDLNLLNLQFSTDNRYFLAARNDRNRIGFRFDTLSVGFDKVAIAVDVTTRKSISIGDNIKSLMTGGATFLSPTALIGEYFRNADRSGIYSFPDGKKIEQIKLAGDTFTMAQQGEYLVIRPISDYPAGIFDVKAKKIIVANKQAAIDVYGNNYVAERRNGELALYDLSTLKALALIALPRNSLGTLHVAQVSRDLKWLAASERSRGAVWNLATGQRIFHIRGFRGAYFAADGNIYADFPKYENTERVIARMMPLEQDVGEVVPLPEDGVAQYGAYLILLTSQDDEKEKSGKSKKEDEENDKVNKKTKDVAAAIAGFIILGGESSGNKSMHMEARDSQQGRSLWTREFPDGAPDYWGNAEHGTLTLAWSLSTKAARNIVKSDAGLSKKLSAMGDKEGDYLVQVLELKTGKILGQLLIETGKGSFRIDGMTTAGDWVLIEDTENRVLVYSLSSGLLKQRFFGDRAIISASDGLVCVENERGQLIVYDLYVGAKRDEFSFSSNISTFQFVEGRRLFVLTANQTAYLLDLAKKSEVQAVKPIPRPMSIVSNSNTL